MTIDILIRTYRRPAALAVTLTSLVSQTCRDFRIVISDQTEDSELEVSGEVRAVIRVLRAHGHVVEHKYLPRRGIAEQRQFLLNQAIASYSLLPDNEPVKPEVIKPNTLQWERWRLHNAANIYHIQQYLELTLPINVSTAWLGLQAA